MATPFWCHLAIGYDNGFKAIASIAGFLICAISGGGTTTRSRADVAGHVHFVRDFWV